MVSKFQICTGDFRKLGFLYIHQLILPSMWSMWPVFHVILWWELAI